MTTTDWAKAQYHLANDPILNFLIANYGPCTLEPKNDYFMALSESIISQQLSAKAADKIFRRFLNYYGGIPTPEKVAATPTPDLKNMGLSKQKCTYIQSLAENFLNSFITPHDFKNMSDQQIISQLISVKGVGVWTAQIFLIFALNRPDVLPTDDLGIKKAVQKLYNLDCLPNKTKIEEIAQPWHPFCSIASWYLWKSLNNT